jgi:allantoinase
MASLNNRYWVKSHRMIYFKDAITKMGSAAFLVNGEKVEELLTDLEHLRLTQVPVFDFGNHVVMSGSVDTHVHINEPGRTEWEGFETATHAAAAGGVTTLIDMPLNCIPATVSAEAVQIKMATCQNKCLVDYGFWGGVIPGNIKELKPMVEFGVMGFKAFMCESGVSEFPLVNENELRQALIELKNLNRPLIVHAELEGRLDPSKNSNDSREYRNYLSSRPPSWEVNAIRMLIRLAKEMGGRVHVVHLSAADALQEIHKAKGEGIKISAETCPHYLTLNSENIGKGETHFKCAPPIRQEENRQKLWDGLVNGDIDFIVSDHSPCTPALKLREEGNFEKAWGGISGLQFSLPVIWSELKKQNKSLIDLNLWLSQKPAAFLGIQSKKGSIQVDGDADFLVWDPESQFSLSESMVLHRHHLSPYVGKRFVGKVLKTYLRGSKSGEQIFKTEWEIYFKVVAEAKGKRENGTITNIRIANDRVYFKN